MLLRCAVIMLVFCVTFSVVWAKTKDTPLQLMERSDKCYYFPTQHGLNDLAVDFSVTELAKDPVGKNAHITFYYTNAGQQFLDINNIPASEGKFRDALSQLLTPIAQYIVPQTSVECFSGLTVKASKVTQVLNGVKGTTFYNVIGTFKEVSPEGATAYRILYSPEGLIRQIELTMKEGKPYLTSVENIKSPAGWHVAKKIMRILGTDNTRWRIDQMEYSVIDGLTLPTKFSMTFRDFQNTPIPNMADMTIVFTNYRVNQGVAAAALAAPATTPKPAATP